MQADDNLNRLRKNKVLCDKLGRYLAEPTIVLAVKKEGGMGPLHSYVVPNQAI